MRRFVHTLVTVAPGPSVVGVLKLEKLTGSDPTAQLRRWLGAVLSEPTNPRDSR